MSQRGSRNCSAHTCDGEGVLPITTMLVSSAVRPTWIRSLLPAALYRQRQSPTISANELGTRPHGAAGESLYACTLTFGRSRIAAKLVSSGLEAASGVG